MIKLPFGWELRRHEEIADKDVNPIPILVARAGQNLSGAPDKPPADKDFGDYSGESLFNRSKPDRSTQKQRLANAPLDSIGGNSARKSVETIDTWNIFSMFNTFSRRKHRGRLGLASSFDIDSFESLDVDYIVEILADLSPELSNALWTYVLMCNSGFELKAYKKDSDEAIDENAQKILNSFLTTLGNYNGTIDVFFDRLFIMLFLRGSILMELVLEENARDFADIATPDTKTLEYRRMHDKVRGQYWQFGQRQNSEFIALDIPTIRYVPLHPLPDSIEGRPIATPVLFPAIFLMSILRDTKRVVQHQGYLRLDVEILFDKLRETMPEEFEGNASKVRQWMNDIVADVKTAYENLKPTDTYIHSDAVKINNPVGTVSADSLGAIDGLFKALERMCVRALKSMPILMATDMSRSETQANREWEIYAKGIETVQHIIENAFSYICGLALEAQGIQADVQLRFATFRAAEKMRDVQVEFLTAKVARFLYDCGIISQDEQASLNGYSTSDQTEPRVSGNATVSGTGFGNETTTNPNEGEARTLELTRTDALAFMKTQPELFNRMFDRLLHGGGKVEVDGDIVRYIYNSQDRMPTIPEADAAEDFFKTFAPDDAQELLDADVVEE